MSTVSMVSNAPTVFAIARSRIFPTVLLVLRWTFTWLMMTTLTLGSLIAVAYISAGGFNAAWGAIVWMVMTVSVAGFGTLAFLCKGQFLRSVIFFLVSLVSNYCLMLSFFALILMTPLFLIAPLLALNASYFYLAVRFFIPDPLPARRRLAGAAHDPFVGLAERRRREGGPT